jgi:hypothetical protein
MIDLFSFSFPCDSNRVVYCKVLFGVVISDNTGALAHVDTGVDDLLFCLSSNGWLFASTIHL